MFQGLIALFFILLTSATLAADWVWWEAEAAKEHSFPPSNAFSPSRDESTKLSGGNWLQTHQGSGKTANWEVLVEQAGTYEIWTRKFWKHGPFQWRFNRDLWQACGSDCALADSVELRQNVVANWVYLGKATLKKGLNTFDIKVDLEASAVAFDCFLATKVAFLPRGKLKPDAPRQKISTKEGWTPFDPPKDDFDHRAGFDLRSLNQSRTGAEGYVIRLDDHFAFSTSRRPVRFWGVNLNVEFDRKESADHIARHLAKRGVNLVRLHTPLSSGDLATGGKVDAKTLNRIHYWVHTLSQQGIYTKLSFYFPVWYQIVASEKYPSYDKLEDPHPFGLLFFDKDFQSLYRNWAKVLLTSKNPYSKLTLANDPSVAIVEICNEDNLFFWTFKPHESPPSEVMPTLEKGFASWLKKKYGSLEQTIRIWGKPSTPLRGDDLANDSMGLYAAGRLTREKWAANGRNNRRASDQAAFLHDLQENFYQETIDYFRKDLGVKCAISANNWVTADQDSLGPIDKHSTLVGDLVDRHYYSGGRHEGPGSGYSLRPGQQYLDYSALFDPEFLPTNEWEYNRLPTLVSEFGAPAPNRFRAESPMLAAAYGSLLGTDGFIHFAHQGAPWLRSPSKFGLATPSLLGQFPATAFAYREGLIKTAPVVYEVEESLDNLYKLRGSSALQSPTKDQKGRLPTGISPLTPLVGRVQVQLSPRKFSRPIRKSIDKYVQAETGIVTSATSELSLNHRRGLLRIDAPSAQGFCGFPGIGQSWNTKNLSFKSGNEYVSLLVVALDKRLLSNSQKILVQIVTEDQPNAWKTTQNGTLKQIESVGQAPLLLREIQGILGFKHQAANLLKVTPLDANGKRLKAITPVKSSPVELSFELLPSTLYYLIEP